MINKNLIAEISKLKEADPRAFVVAPPHHTSLWVLIDVLGLPKSDEPLITTRAIASIVILELLSEKLKSEPAFYEAGFDDVIQAAFAFPEADEPELYSTSAHKFKVGLDDFDHVDRAFLGILLDKVMASGNQTLMQRANTFFL